MQRCVQIICTDRSTHPNKIHNFFVVHLFFFCIVFSLFSQHTSTQKQAKLFGKSNTNCVCCKHIKKSFIYTLCARVFIENMPFRNHSFIRHLIIEFTIQYFIFNGIDIIDMSIGLLDYTVTRCQLNVNYRVILPKGAIGKSNKYVMAIY